MDVTLPVAKRTRRWEAEMYRKMHEDLKKQRRMQEQTGDPGLDSNSIVLDDVNDNVLLDEKDVVVETECVTIEDSDEDSDDPNIDDDDEEVDEDDEDSNDDDEEEDYDEDDKDYVGGSGAKKNAGSNSRLNDKKPNRRNKVSASEEYEDMKRLAQSMWHNAQLILEEEKSSEKVINLDEGDSPVLHEKTTLPLKFTYGDPEFTQAEKTEEYAESFSDLDLILGANEDDKDYVGGSGAKKNTGSNSRLNDKKPNKRNTVSASKEYGDMKNLAQSMWHNAQLILEEEKSSEKVNNLDEGDGPVLHEQTTLPMKFTFGDPEFTHAEKTEECTEHDELFADLDLILCASYDNSAAPSVTNDGDSPCRKGSHCFILDEEKGLVCKYCSLVHLEIKYHVHPFADNPYGRAGKKDSEMMEQDVLSQLHNDSSDPGCDPCTQRQGTVWSLIPEIAKGMYDHQREGFEFLWKNIAGGIHLKKLKDSCSTGGHGCIISHTPGTGKTLLAIAFIQTYMEVFPECRPLIVAPCIMLHIWQKEFDKWNVKFPFHNLKEKELSGKEDKDASSKVMSGNSKYIRMVKIHSWMKDRSILGISYKLFEKIVTEEESSDENKLLLRNVLLNLPGLLVLDEGHTPRNSNSLLWKAFEKVKTAKRIILSGTPFQNNFDELFNTLSLVNPSFLDSRISRQKGTHSKRQHRRGKARQFWSDLTNQISKTSDHGLRDQKLEEVGEIIGQFVHRYEGGLLQEKVKGLKDSVVILKPFHLQKTIIDDWLRDQKPSFSLDHCLSGVAVHPSLLPKECFPTREDVISWSRLQRMQLDTDAGVKSKFLMELIHLSVVRNEKVLVFSQYINTLKLVSDQIRSKFKWRLGEDFLYFDGQLAVDARKTCMDTFNKRDSGAKVMLASIKASCEGISLVGASRVVLLDVVWNPATRTQAISRAYRLGQEKIVHVYDLIASETMEEEKFRRQVNKERLSEMIFRPGDGSSSRPHLSADNNHSNDDMVLEAMLERNRDMFKTIYQHTD